MPGFLPATDLKRAHHGSPDHPPEGPPGSGLVLAVGGGHLVELDPGLELLHGLVGFGLLLAENVPDVDGADAATLLLLFGGATTAFAALPDLGAVFAATTTAALSSALRVFTAFLRSHVLKKRKYFQFHSKFQNLAIFFFSYLILCLFTSSIKSFGGFCVVS